MRLLKQRIKPFLTAAALISLSACASMQIQDIRPTVRLPASGDCYGVTVLSHMSYRTPKRQCDDFMKRAICLSQADWQKQRYDVQKNCQLASCKQLIGAFDNLFLTLDAAAKEIEKRK